MKSKVAILLFFSVLFSSFWSSNLFGQDSNDENSTNKEPFLNKLSVSPSIGVLHGFDDFRTEKFMPNFVKPSENKLGFGLLLNYDFLNVLRLSTGILGGKLRGTHEEINTLGAVNEPRDLGIGIFYQTNIFEVTLPRVDVNLSKLIFKDRNKVFNVLSVHAFISHGLLFFDSKVFAVDDESVHLLYGKHRGQSNKTKEAVSSFGMDLSYKLNERIDINLGTMLKYVWNDRLDAWESPGSANDMFSYTSAGVTFYLKKGKDKVKKPLKSNGNLPPRMSENVKVEKTDPSLDSLKPKLTVIEDEAEEDTTKTQEVTVEVKTEIIQDSVVKEVELKEIEELDTTVAEEKETVDTIVSPAPKNTIYNGKGNFIIVAAFQTLKRAKISAAEQIEKGEVATIVKNRSNTLFLISVGRFDDRQEAIHNMREVRKKGKYKDAWVLYKDVEQ